MQRSQGPGLTILGLIASLLLVAGLVGVGAYVLLRGEKEEASVAATAEEPAAPAGEGLVDALSEVPRLDPPKAYAPKDGIVEVELSEYAGYAGLVAANGGLAPSDASWFAQKHGFKVKLTLSEEESWSRLNRGELAASATTVDVLAAYGKQFDVVVPAQIAFSRGADGIVVRSDVKRLNDLKGKTVVAAQFTEAEFFLRYLAQEAGIPVQVGGASPDGIGVVFAEDAFTAGDVFLADMDRYAGCVTWEPKTSEVVAASGGKAHVLATNRNLLVIADILVVNRGFAQANPAIVAGLVDGLLEGNRRVRAGGEREVVARAFGWDAAKTEAELAKVHLSNHPENLAFFSGAIDMAGSFGGIFQSAVYAYGRGVVREAIDPARFVDVSHLEAQKGAYADQVVEIAPIRQAAGTVEQDPLLSKDIRFLFEPNSSKLDMQDAGNLARLADLKRLLQVSPGSTVLLRGHVDDGMVPEFRKQGGEAFVRQMALKAVELSRNRAAEVERQLVATHGVDDARVETVGLGWDEPAGKVPEENRRVEVQWFTVE
ncbi:MAG: OmpA family protein [Myxococcota bacterium]